MLISSLLLSILVKLCLEFTQGGHVSVAISIARSLLNRRYETILVTIN